MRKLLLILALLICSPLGAVTWTHVAAGSGNASAYGSAATLSGKTIASGSLVVVGCVLNQFGRTLTLTDNSSGPGDSFTTIITSTELPIQSSLHGEMTAWALNASAGTPPTSFTCTMSGSGSYNITIFVDTYTGGPNPFVMHGSAGAPNMNTTGSPTQSVTTGPAGSLLWSLEGPSVASQGAATVASPFTREQANATYGVTSDAGTGSGLAASTGYTATYTQTSAVSWGVGIVEFESALAAPSFSPGTETSLTTVTVTPTIPGGSTGCFTVDGSTPTATTPGTCLHGTTYTTGTLSITGPGTTQLQMLATQSGRTNSSVTSASYIVGIYRYYIDKSCATYNGNGTSSSCAGSAGAVGAFNSIANAQTGLTGSSPGVSLLLAMGETFREMYTVPAYGTAGGQFTLGSYGSGALPIISGSSLVTSWTYVSGNLWSATVSPTPHSIYFNGTYGTYESGGTGSLAAPGEWYYTATTLTVNDGSSSNAPNVVYTTPGVEAPARAECINTNTEPYITIQNIACTQGDNFGILVTGSNTAVQGSTVTNIHSGSQTFNGHGEPIMVQNASSILLQNNTVSNSTWGVDIQATAVNVVGVTIQYNKLSYTEADCIDPWVSGGYTVTGLIEQYNATDHCAQLLADAVSAGASAGLSIGSIIRYNLNSNCGNASTGCQGFIQDTGGTNAQVYYNINYGNWGDCLGNGGAAAGGSFWNNTCYQDDLIGSSWSEANFYGSSSGNAFKNNIFFCSAGMNCVTGSGSQTWDYNLWFGGLASPFYWAANARSFAYWQGTLAFDTHGKQADPQYVNPAGGDFHLLMTSPGIAAGTSVGLTMDFYGNPVIPGFISQGAIQYQPRPGVGGMM